MTRLQISPIQGRQRQMRSLLRTIWPRSGDHVPSVLVLTPVKNASKHLPGYVDRIRSLQWPRTRLRLGMLESDSEDGTWEQLRAIERKLSKSVSRVTLVKRDFGYKIPEGMPRWQPEIQMDRRCILAKARNQLLFRALQDEDWVLWLDVDVIDYPRDIIKKLIAFGLDIVHPHCVTQAGGRTFDRNAWSHHGSRTLEDMRGNSVVPLDSVGGTMLLVRADRHRDGLVFPPFRYGVDNPRARPSHPDWGKGEIETEGLGIMALDMGLQCWGLPDLEIIHANE